MALNVNFNLSEAKTAIPLVADGHKCKVRFAGCKGRTNPEKGDSLSLENHLLEKAPTTDAGVVEPGFPLFDSIYLYDKNTAAGEFPPRAITKISKYLDGFLGTGDPGNKKGKPARPNIFEGLPATATVEDIAAKITEALISREAYAQVKVKTGDFEGNEIVKIIHPSDLNA